MLRNIVTRFNLACFASLLLCCLILIWLLVAVLLNPATAGALVLGVGSLVFYVVSTVRGLTTLRARFEKTAGKSRVVAAGLSLSHIYTIVLYGIVVLLLVLTWLALALKVFGGATDSVGGALTALVAPVTAIVAKSSALGSVKAKVEQFENNIIGGVGSSVVDTVLWVEWTPWARR